MCTAVTYICKWYLAKCSTSQDTKYLKIGHALLMLHVVEGLEISYVVWAVLKGLQLICKNQEAYIEHLSQ